MYICFLIVAKYIYYIFKYIYIATIRKKYIWPPSRLNQPRFVVLVNAHAQSSLMSIELRDNLHIVGQDQSREQEVLCCYPQL